jgi:hypothetical protein
MESNDWEWVVERNVSKHTERVSVIRAIDYEMTTSGLSGLSET